MGVPSSPTAIQASEGKRVLVHAAASEVDQTCFANTAILVTQPGEAPVLQWIVDTSLLGPELTAFHENALGGLGALIEHPPARGAPRGFTELRIATKDVPCDVVEQLHRRLRAAIRTNEADGTT